MGLEVIKSSEMYVIHTLLIHYSYTRIHTLYLHAILFFRDPSGASPHLERCKWIR